MAGKEVVLDGELSLLNQIDGEAGTVIKVGHGTGISDVQINGASIVADRVANIPYADTNTSGTVMVDLEGRCGIGYTNHYDAEGNLVYTNQLCVINAITADIKAEIATHKFIAPRNQHIAAFYGLAKAAGHDENNSNLPVGQYTEEAKTAIRTMLGLQDVYDDYSSALTALGVI